MLRRTLTTVTLSLGMMTGVFAQTTNAFRIDYDLAAFDLPINSTEALTNGNYIFSGFHTNFFPIVSSLTEVNSTGVVQWSKQYSGGISYMFGDFKKDATLNRYYACGGSSSGPAFLLFIDAAGLVTSGKNFSIAQADGAFFNRVIKTSDNGYLCVGYVTGYDPDGGGAEVDFNSVTNNDVSCNSSDTETIESPLIVKFDASGNHLWHHVFRYYATSATPANRIYNDASFVDAVEVSDGYLAIGNYDVNNVYSTFDTDDCDDTTPTDAMFLKTTTAGAITYHRQIDNPSNSTGQTSKSLASATLTAAGLPLISGSDGDTRPCLLMRLPGSGGWANPTWIRKYGAGSLFLGAYYPFIPGRFFETNDGNYAAWLSYVPISLPTTFSSVLMKINSSTSSPIFTKQYTFGNDVMATLFPHGQQVSDNGYIGVSYMFGASGHNMHFIKTDPNGDAPSACPDTDLSVSNETPSYTYGTPIYNSWNANTVTNVSVTPTVTNITPVTSVVCSSVPCTPPAAPVAAVATQPTCASPTGSVTLTGLPTSGTWTVTGTPSGSATGSTSSTTITGLAPGNYTFTVTLSGCESTASNSVTINAASGAPSAPVIGTITQTTCTVSTGSVDLSGLPSSGTWTVTVSPGGQTINGTGTTTTITGLAPGTYTFTVSTSGGGGGGPVTVYSENFDGNGGAGSTWNTLNSNVGAQGSAANLWFISDQEDGNAAGQCGSAGSGDQSLHVGSTTAGDAGAAYDASAPNAFFCGIAPPLGCPVNTNKRSFSNNINTTGMTGMTLAFNYIENGEGADDNAILEYSINGGATWLTLFDLAKTPLGACAPQGTWTAYSVSLPATCENITNLRIGFRWQNDADGVGTDPSFAVDDITITAPGGGGGSCTSSPSASATINPQPSTPAAPVVGAITQPSCSTPTGSVALSGLPASGTWTVTASPGGATATGTGTTTNFTGLTAGGTYTFTVSNGSCTSTASTSAAINTAPVVPTAPIVGAITQPTCSTPTGTVALSGLPASGTWTITASPGGANSTGTGTTTNFTGLTGGNTYTFTVSNGTCTSSASTNAAINAAPTVPTAPVIGTITQPSCSVSSGSIQLTGLPASGTWTVTGTPSGTATGTGTSTTITGLGAGNYTFTVSNGTCTSASSVSTTINAAPTTPTAPVVGSVTQPTCSTATGSVALSGLPASGTWTVTAAPGGLTLTSSGTTATFSGLGTGNYTFTVENAAGCISTASTAASINAQPTTPSAPVTGTVTQPTCTSPTGSVDLSGLPSSGSWTITASPGGAFINGSGTSTTFTGLTAGNSYTFTVTNAQGCTSTATASIAINSVPGAPTAPVIDVVIQPTCSVSTGSVTLSGLPASGTWTLTTTPGSTSTGTGTTTTLNGLTAGTDYTFTVTNSLGCTSSSSLTASVNAAPTTPTAPIVGAITQPSCTVATGSVELSGLPASGTWTVTSSPGGLTLTSTGTTATFSGLSANTTYTFTVENASGCTSTASTSAAINSQPTTPSAPITGTVTQPTCTAPTGSVVLSGLPSSGSWTVTVSPGGTSINGSGTSTTFTGLAAGNNYSFTVTNAQGCTSVASASVTINTVPGAPSSPVSGTVTQPTCAVPTGSFDVTSPIGAQYTYSIDGTNFQASASFTGLAPGSYTVTVLDNNSGCSTVATTTTVVDPIAGLPVISLVSSSAVTCNGDADGTLTADITGGTAPYTYSWTPNAGSTLSLTGLSGGDYTLSVTDDNGCSVSETFTISEPNALAVNGTVTDVICGTNDGSITTAPSGGTSPFTYLWTPGGETASSLSGLAGGNYGVTVTDDNGCTATGNFTVDIIGSLGVNVTPSYSEVNEGETVQLTASGGEVYSWTPATGLSCTDCPNPVATATQDIVYYVTATDDNGCTGSDSAVIVLKLPCGEIYVPTVFSPNGKGPQANDKLCVFGTPACVEELLFQVYDRWGEKVFETTDISICWDGKYKGKEMNSGIYVYRLYVKLSSGEEIDTSGNTTLVR